LNLRPLLLSALLLVPACSSSGDVTTADGGRDTRDALPDAVDAAPAVVDDATSDAPPACNTLSNIAATITVEQVATDPPAPQGGTPVDGLYTLTATVIYTGTDGPSGAAGTAQTTLQLSGSTIQVASAGEPATRTVTFTTSGTSIASTDACPDTDAHPGTYTATPTTFTVELDGGTDDAGARTLVETFTKQ
jgi:hypothetical protein